MKGSQSGREWSEPIASYLTILFACLVLPTLDNSWTVASEVERMPSSELWLPLVNARRDAQVCAHSVCLQGGEREPAPTTDTVLGTRDVQQVVKCTVWFHSHVRSSTRLRIWAVGSVVTAMCWLEAVSHVRELVRLFSHLGLDLLKIHPPVGL